MNAIAARGERTAARQFEHCGHLMMLVRLPALTSGRSMQSQTGWRCNVCGTIVGLSTISGRNSWLNKATEPRQVEWLSVGLQLRRHQVARSTV